MKTLNAKSNRAVFIYTIVRILHLFFAYKDGVRIKVHAQNAATRWFVIWFSGGYCYVAETNEDNTLEYGSRKIFATPAYGECRRFAQYVYDHFYGQDKQND